MPIMILTGATRGIGRAAAIALAGRGVELGVVGRDPARVRATVEDARAAGGGALVHEHVADLATMDEVRRLGAELLESYPRIDVLANNAGAMFTSRHVTPDGFEQTFALNHLAPFLLTSLLLERLAVSGGRVVTTASDAHKGVGSTSMTFSPSADADAPAASTARASSATSSSPASCSADTPRSRPIVFTLA
jgi:NAD(P)-dependent dehydrogenase (short-subunit alcohol dehydrogenase family)